ncbi:TERF1-interacting nuclear factor 2 isoform X2 [Malaclemys terrapin pileata]|uniref:TERF1-interacting nuclear factor 2 isoform X2 n=1 Tax=Malaclemys terrapin pileata TaxID=2991368 RepID=UPI0023A858B1|nr:TERF1-interacting nuclear factor 2 isoform X2 [Malaclemys terrapin pileata]
MAGSDVRQNGQAAGGITPAPPGQDPCAPLRLAAVAAWQVMRARQVRDFPRVLGLLEAVGQAAPDVVFFRHYARLRLGLQAAVIMGMLQEEQPDGKIYDAVDTYFPEGEHRRHPLATARDLRLVGEAQETFRELVLGLLSDRQRRETYVEEQLEAEYGEPFLGGLEGLLYEYLGRLESTLPPPQLQQLQEAAWSECPLAGPPQRPSELSVLAQYLTDMGHHQHTVPGTPGSRQRRSQEGAAPAQEEMPPDLGLHCQPPGEQDLDTSGDIVWESEEEESCGPRRKASYQCTRYNTLIPTFCDHLDPPSGCPGCCAPGPLPPPHGTDAPASGGCPTKPLIGDTK